ncbi:unnamed protein product [Rhizophagus irregularis]|nr:unnamed protein product [Rhizophagus irregularis]
MTDVSSMASARWKNEPEHVKREYLWRDHSNKNSNTRTQKAKTSPTPQSPRKKQQTSQSSTQEPKQQPRHQFQPLNISHPFSIMSRIIHPPLQILWKNEYLPFTNADYDIFNQPSYPMTNNYWAPNELFIFDINNNHLN